MMLEWHDLYLVGFVISLTVLFTLSIVLADAIWVNWYCKDDDACRNREKLF